MSSTFDDRLLALTAEVVTAYVSNNHIQPSDLPEVLTSVYRVMWDVESKRRPIELPPKLTQQEIERSITKDFLISFEDGKPYKTLRRHLAMHGLTPDAYRAKWGLDASYPMTSPSYSERRSELARALGLGKMHRVPAGQSSAQSGAQAAVAQAIAAQAVAGSRLKRKPVE
ncbi:MucR family transcriptional regulator [Methylobacterium sp. J-067]|uniref:MucR family transcriptional regulator n=1 Tax=Methylobacterium sp. J-067 TaxID=2836648 RepID=UPI001FB8EB94|nr:MucR family transcriptional regulator [Methylobacterium sp. J-067]MCJ2022674.1 MucR family transcriptional regulator [Methylobacterium sp. J-067]